MSTIAVLGGGQLGRMLALAGTPLDLRLRVLDPSHDAPAAAVAEHVCAGYGDTAALERLTRGAVAATFEFEHVPLATAQWIAERMPLRPGMDSLRICGDRLLEKQFVCDMGGEVAPFAPVDDEASLLAAVQRIGVPAILKTRTQGFDGRGQHSVDVPEQAFAAWNALGRVPAILERRVAFKRELALIAVRGLQGETRFYPLIETRHRDGILVSAIAPAADVSPEITRRAEQLATRLLDGLRHVGVLAMECFERDGQLLVNELAPRVHNSGHWTLEGAATSQFENHLRAILGLPLGNTEAREPTALVNLIGRLPDMREVLSWPDTHLHLYAKRPRAGRKLGHVTLRAAHHETLHHRVEAIEAMLAETVNPQS